MKLVINAASAKMGGALRYITSLLEYLPTAFADSEIVVLLPPGTAARLPRVSPNVILVPVAISHATWWRRLWWDWVTLRRFLRREKADALFAVGNFGVWHCPVRQVLLVNNALYFSEAYWRVCASKHPLWRRIELRLRRWLAVNSIRNADVVMVPSEAMLHDLRRFVEVGERRTLVNAYGAVETGDTPPPRRHPAIRQDAPVRLLYVSLYAEHKNLATLLRAMPILNANGGYGFELTTLANPASESLGWSRTWQRDLELARRPDVRDHVRLVGPLKQKETLELYRQADLAVFPSFVESFGFPMVEAMAHGLPIVAADTPINREICQDAAVYFEPFSETDLARKVLDVHGDANLRAHMAKAGRSRVTHCFRWEDHIQRLIEAVRGEESGERAWSNRSAGSVSVCGAGTLPAAHRTQARKPAPQTETIRLGVEGGVRIPVTVIILTRNEELNIAECLESVQWAAEVIVLDSFSTDSTVQIAKGMGAKVFSHSFEGYARQRNWALSDLPICNEWVLILDADERIPDELASEIGRCVRVPEIAKAGFYLARRHIFMGRWLKHGGLYPTWGMRLFRRRLARYEDRPMNEHVILEGGAGYLKQAFEHRDRRPLSNWIAKHNRYADLQAAEYFGDRAGRFPESLPPRLFGTQAARKRWLKLRVWNRLPLLFRPFLFFFRNYVLKAGFLDGRPGLIYHVLWSFWFPFLADVKIIEKRAALGGKSEQFAQQVRQALSGS